MHPARYRSLRMQPMQDTRSLSSAAFSRRAGLLGGSSLLLGGTAKAQGRSELWSVELWSSHSSLIVLSSPLVPDAVLEVI
jgi:hypothetical protein